MTPASNSLQPFEYLASDLVLALKLASYVAVQHARGSYGVCASDRYGIPGPDISFQAVPCWRFSSVSLVVVVTLSDTLVVVVPTWVLSHM